MCACVYLGECLWGTERKHSKQKEELIPERMTRDKLEGQLGLREQRGMQCEIKRQRPNMEQERILCCLFLTFKKKLLEMYFMCKAVHNMVPIFNIV